MEQSPSLFPAQWQEDSKSAFLMASTRGRLLVLGVDPFAEVRCTGFADGDCLWDLSLQRTGDDKLEGDVFGEVVDLFFLGGRGRGRAAPGCVLLRSFRRTAGCKQPFFCVIYYMLRSGGVAAVFKAIAKGGSSILGHPGQTRAMFQASTTRRPLHALTTVEGLLP